jgi:hypothetical protein
MYKLIIGVVIMFLLSCKKESYDNVSYFYQEGIYITDTNWHFHESGHYYLNLPIHKSRAEIYRDGKTYISGKEYVDTLNNDTIIKFMYNILY